MTEKEKGKTLRMIIEEMKIMPEEISDALCPIIENFPCILALVREVCRETKPSPEELTLWCQNAMEREQHTLFVLLNIAEVILTNGDEPL